MTDERYMRPGVEFALAKLNEECGELIAALGKTLRWGFDSFDPTSDTRESNEAWIFREIEDLEGAIRNFKKEVARTTPFQRSTMFGYGRTGPQS